jgi:hypothetical protein
VVAIVPRAPGLIWVLGLRAGDVMVDGSIRGGRLRSLGLWWTAARGREPRKLWELAGRLAVIWEWWTRRNGSAEGSGDGFERFGAEFAQRELRVLSDLREPDDVLKAVRASCTVPLLNSAPQRFRGELLVDGGFVESVPFRSALREGATHVLALRTRDGGYRLPEYRRFAELAMRLAGPELASLLRGRPHRYNGEADELEGLASHPAGRPSVTQVMVPRERRLVDHLDTDVAQIRECIRLGASAVESLVLGNVAERLEAAA